MDASKQEILPAIIELATEAVKSAPDPSMPWYQIFSIVVGSIVALSGALFTWVKFFKNRKDKQKPGG